MQAYFHYCPFPKAPVLLILTGVNSGPYLFDKAVSTLGQTHQLVIGYPPGSGGDRRFNGTFSARDYAETARGWLEELGLKGPFALLGHSLGSFAAQELARLEPTRVQRLVLVSSSIGQPYLAKDMVAMQSKLGMSFWEWSKALEADPATHLKVLFGPQYPSKYAAEYAAFMTLRKANTPSKTVVAAQLGAGGVFSSVRWLHELAMPTLVVQGEVDILTPAKTAKKLAEKLPNARYLELFGVGHFPMLEHAGFYAAVGRFLHGANEGQELTPPPNWWQKFQQNWLHLHG